MNIIKLFLSNGTWMAQSIGPHAEQIIEIFETDTLPTAFTDKTDAETVKANIEALNPGIAVEVLQG